MAARRAAAAAPTSGGIIDVSSTAGWGSELTVTLPLDPPADAAALDISANTVKFHVSNLLRKAGVRSRAELVAVALR
jgi:large exoprotein involved in heme utilization and adhesion